MCVRTKTSYGCGHTYRLKSDCHSSDCPGPHKYHYVKESDCRECRVEQPHTPRAADVPLRSAPKKRSKVRDDNPSSSAETLRTDEHDVSGGASPWAQQKSVDKTSWDSPYRRRADEAWVSEHDDRIIDLNERMEKVQLSEGRLRSKYSNQLVVASENRECDDYDQDESDFVHVTPSKKHRADVRRRLGDKAERSRSNRTEHRQHSHDSLPDSMPSYRSSPKMKKSSTSNVVNSYPEDTYDYDYYNSSSSHLPPKHHRRHHQGHGRSRSDTYHSRGKSYGHESDYEIAPIPPIQMALPTPAGYETYEYYAHNASPPVAAYTYPEYPCEISPRPQHYVNYGRY